MNCASRLNSLPPYRFRARRGLTLVEMLVALTVVLIFFGGALYAFLEIVRTKEQTQARLDALANGRHALETMTQELKRARLLPSETSGSQTFQEDFQCTNTVLAFGDRIDNDRDGQVDEEQFNGLDDDGDWTAPSDRHAAITSGSQTYYERRAYRTNSDLDDAHVDEDTVFTSGAITFETFPLPTGSSPRRVSFWLGEDLDGEPNTLMLQITEPDPGQTPPLKVATAPVAHNVLSFTALCYDAETSSSTPWQTRWNSDDRVSSRSESPTVPVSVYLAVTTYSGAQPLSTLTPQQPLENVTLHTIVDVESVLADPRYDAKRNSVTASP